MSAGHAALIALFLSAPLRATDARLATGPELEPGSFPGLTLSLGSGRRVCAKLTFDRSKAELGGFIFVTDAGEAGDEDAVRLSEAVIARRGGLISRVAIAARRHGVPAVALGRGVWDPAPSLILREPLFGPVVMLEGLPVRAENGERELTVHEGDAACVDAVAGRVTIPPSGEASARISAGEASRAFDGLRDEAALEHWLKAQPNTERAAALMDELAPRALDGEIAADDLARVEKAALAAAGSLGASALRHEQKRAFRRALRATREELVDCALAAADAPAGDVLKRLARDAQAIALRAAAAGDVFGAGDGGLGALARNCADVARKRQKSVPASSASLDQAAAAAGATRPRFSVLLPDAWLHFIADNDLASFLEGTAGDASLSLAAKSARIRARILAGRLAPSSEAGRAILTAAPLPCLLVGESTIFQADQSRDLLAAVREAWAASWAVAPLGARLRAGLDADYDGRLRFARAARAQVSGLLFSRDPGSGLRRVLVEAGPGSLAELFAGRSSADHYVLDPESGRALEVLPAAAGGKTLISPDRLKRLARLARALDAWRGGGVEVAFSLDGDQIEVDDAQPLEVRERLEGVADSLSPRPAPEVLNVKPLR